MTPRNSRLSSQRGAGIRSTGAARMALVLAVMLMATVLLSPVAALAVDAATINEINALKERLSQLEAKVAADSARAETSAASGATAQEQRNLRDMVTEVVNSSTPDIRIGGALRVNYGYQDWSETSKDKGGDFAFDTFRFNLDGSIKDIIFSAEYRFYPEYDFNTIHHGYMGYNFTDDLQVQLGIHQVPFGLQPFASHNFWFSGLYYIGLEDDYDMGIKLLYNPVPGESAAHSTKMTSWADPAVPTATPLT